MSHQVHKIPGQDGNALFSETSSFFFICGHFSERTRSLKPVPLLVLQKLVLTPIHWCI